MPSIFTRNRRASESMPTANIDDPIRSKRRSMDAGRPPVSGAKFMNIFTGNGNSQGDDEGRRDSFRRRLSSASQVFGEGGDDGKHHSLRQKLSSASQIFHKAPQSQPQPSSSSAAQPITPTRTNGNSTAGPSPSTPNTGAAGRYEDPSPRSPGRSEFASPTLFPGNFSLSGTASPESKPGGRRGSVSWQPSYPTVVPDDSYADVAPDGHLVSPIGPASPTSPAMPSENEHRRSLVMPSLNGQAEELNGKSAVLETKSGPPNGTELAINGITGQDRLPTPSPDEFPQTDTRRPSTPPRIGPAPLPTPPSSAISPSRPLPADANEAKSPNARPILSLVTGNGSQTEHVQNPIPASDTSDNASQSQRLAVGHSATSPISLVSLNDSALPTPTSANVPIGSNGRPRPDMPIRRSTLIQSPPMPQPIKNLPTMVGWPAFMRDGVPGTPSWGTLAKEGGPKTPGAWMGGGAPKTPGWGGMMSPSSSTRMPQTPGSAGFPFSLPPTPAGQSKGKEKGQMSEEELRKARRAMPVMLREPSFKPQEHQGGETGASDSDEDGESETEMEGHPDDDSEPETETERTASTSVAAKSTKVSPLRARLKGKGKGRTGSAGVSSLAATALREEEDSGSNPSQSTTSLSDRRAAGSRIGLGLKLDTASPTTAPKEAKRSFWSLPTPKEKQAASASTSSWTFFSGTPAATPAEPSGPSFNRTEEPQTPGPAPTVSRTDSGITGTDSRPSMLTESSDGYFGSQPSSSSASLTVEPTLVKDPSTATTAGVTANLAGLGLGAIVGNDQRVEGATIPLPKQKEPLPNLREETSPRSEEGEDAHGDVSEEDRSDDSPGVSSQGHLTASPVPPSPQATTDAPGSARPNAPKRPSFYTRASRSMVDLSTSTSTQPEPIVSQRPQLETIRSREAAPTKIELPSRIPISGTGGTMSPATEWAQPPPTPAAGLASFFWSKTKEGKEIGQLKRRRSADDLVMSPPKYEPPHPGVVIPRPRDEEGREKLPKYWCAVHIEGTLSRKMEFSKPGVQSRDRSWKKLYFIVRGTTLLVYKFDPHRFPLKIEPPHPVPTVTEDESEEYLHVHAPRERRVSVSVVSPPSTVTSGRRGSTESTMTTGRRGSGPTPFIGQVTSDSARRTSVSSVSGSSLNTAPSSATSASGEKDPAIFPTPTSVRRGSASTGTSGLASSVGSGSNPIASHFQQNSLVKQYTLQNAESGLAADYVKRKNVVRVRAEGEQFLLQTDSARDVVDWIESFQAATNVALDLDDRPMPKIITLPRRRRRRVPGAAGAAAAAGTAATTDANPGTNDTPAGNAAAVAAVERAAAERERMLAEDQQAPTQAA